MDLDEAMDSTITKRQAAREIMRHGHDPADFFAEVGEREEYTGASVLVWLGY